MSQPHTASIQQARDDLTDIVDRATQDGALTRITKQGKEIAAVVPIELLYRYQQLEDQELIRLAHERMSDTKPGIPLEQVIAEFLDAPE